MSRDLISRFSNSRRGNIALISALMLAPAAVGGGAVFDLMRANGLKAKVQEVADGAALAGARQLGVTNSADAAQAQAVSFVQGNAGATPLQANATSDIASKLTTVEVSGQSPTFVLGIFGAPSLKVSATAKAETKSSVALCMLALSGAAAPGLDATGAAGIEASGCRVWVNSAASTALSLAGAAKLVAGELCVHGGVSVGKPQDLAPAAQDCGVREDPFAQLTVQSPTACDFQDVVVKEPAALTPGVYCGGLSVTANGEASLRPGTYFIRNGAFGLNGAGSISGAGVTFVLEGASSVDLSGGGTVNLAAPSSGSLMGVLFYQRRDANPGATALFTGGSDAILKGALYFPTQTLSLRGHANLAGQSPCTPMIADKLRFTGSSAVKLACDKPEVPLPPVLVLPPGGVLVG